MPATDGEREFAELIRSKLADEAKDYQDILDALPADWFEQIAQPLRDGVRKGVNTFDVYLSEGFRVRIRLDVGLGYRRGDEC